MSCIQNQCPTMQWFYFDETIIEKLEIVECEAITYSEIFKNIEKVVFNREKCTFNINGLLSCVSQKEPFFIIEELLTPNPGRKTKEHELIFTSDSKKYIINFIIVNAESKDLFRKNSIIEIKIQITTVYIENKYKQTSFLEEYCINAPPLIINNCTGNVFIDSNNDDIVSFHQNYPIEKEIVFRENSFPNINSCMTLDIKGCSIFIYKPKVINCADRNTICISYHGEILKQEERQILRDLISFYMGRKLLLITSKEICSNGGYKQVSYSSGWGVSYYNQSTFCPLGENVLLNDILLNFNHISKIFTSYDLHLVLDLFWSASINYAELGLVQYQSCFEYICNRSYEVPDDNGILPEKNRINVKIFESLLNEDISVIKEKMIKNKDFLKITDETIVDIEGTMRRAYEKSIGETIRGFLNRYNIDLSDDKKKAVKIAMSIKHGSFEKNPAEIVKAYYVYRDYISEIILKLLKYDNYVNPHILLYAGMNEEIKNNNM